MDYELAKELKVSGFTSRFFNLDTKQRPDQAWTEPLLSELIDTCGDGIVGIERDSLLDKWRAEGRTHQRFYTEWFSTPIEAVAMLWFALNKKK